MPYVISERSLIDFVKWTHIGGLASIQNTGIPRSVLFSFYQETELLGKPHKVGSDSVLDWSILTFGYAKSTFHVYVVAKVYL